ncbi:hypothetical protein [Vibrio sp. 10N.286.49.B3]|uniref:hypothetical protein n=1 Tax=Vibrio sp. 10N.286.49.B3 TaxID=1880855 RepID=UPI0012FFE0C1|nr:hypothetical protein [Vibrio sp. 10N.286.49.B3]
MDNEQNKGIADDFTHRPKRDGISQLDLSTLSLLIFEGITATSTRLSYFEFDT